MDNHFPSYEVGCANLNEYAAAIQKFDLPRKVKRNVAIVPCPAFREDYFSYPFQWQVLAIAGKGPILNDSGIVSNEFVPATVLITDCRWQAVGGQKRLELGAERIKEHEFAKNAVFQNNIRILPRKHTGNEFVHARKERQRRFGTV
ncbi:MAG: hypothetical protein WB952_18910 [Terriglobales bacterium]